MSSPEKKITGNVTLTPSTASQERLQIRTTEKIIEKGTYTSRFYGS